MPVPFTHSKSNGHNSSGERAPRIAEALVVKQLRLGPFSRRAQTAWHAACLGRRSVAATRGREIVVHVFVGDDGQIDIAKPP